VNTSSHKRKCDPEFAAAEEADKAAKKATREADKEADKAANKATKAANKATRGEKEKVRKAGDKEKERKANRDQRDVNIKRKRSKAEKDESQRVSSKIQYKKQTERDPAPWVIGDGTEEDTLKALVRYHGSTSVAMLLHTDNERIKSNIRKFVRVSPEVKAKIRKAWQEGEMAPNRAHFSCATCGVRDHGNYAQTHVAALPDFFKFREKDQAMYDVLKGVLRALLIFFCVCRSSL
jgi:hypothetical protein